MRQALHRFKITLTLVKKGLTETDDTDFIELARVVNGELQRFVKYSDYSILEHTLARRTFDESGDYEVRPFTLEKREHLNDGSNRGVFLLQLVMKVRLLFQLQARLMLKVMN